MSRNIDYSGRSVKVSGQVLHSRQRTLVDVPATPKLKDRQQMALAILRDAGTAGLQPVQLGALMHDSWSGRHPASAPCDFCASTGNELLRALRRKGVARQRRVDGRTFWQATGLPVAPMGDFPEGF